MNRPAAFGGLRHVALFVEKFAECEQFYVDLLGMQVEWRPDPDNLYLTSGCDNLALHRASSAIDRGSRQKLDHIGFIIDAETAVDEWYTFLKSNGVVMRTAPRTHRDGARSFYCEDPDGTMVQMIWHPPIAGLNMSRAQA